ncbi:MAG: hypothetical protein ACYC6O_05305 [Thermoleophilia bacterium]
MSVIDWIFIGAVSVAPLPLIALLLGELVVSFRRPLPFSDLIVPGRE